MVLFPCLINCISLSFLEAKIMSDFRILLIYKYITKIKRNHLNACGIYFYIFYLIINFFLDNISVCFIFKKKYSAYQYTKMNNGAIYNICVFVKKKPQQYLPCNYFRIIYITTVLYLYFNRGSWCLTPVQTILVFQLYCGNLILIFA